MARGQWQGQHEGIAGHAAVGAEHGRACCRDRDHHRRNHQQVAAEQPARLADIAHVAAFHHCHVELAWQADDGQETQQGLGDETHRRRVLEQGARRLLDQLGASAQPHIGEHAHGDHRQQLDQRLQRDGQHHAVMVFGGIHLSRAEQRGEQGHQQRNVQGGIGENSAVGGAMSGQYAQAQGHGFVLQCQVGHHADQRDHRDQCRQPARAPVARRDEVGDGHRVLAACDQRQALDDAPAEQEQQHGAQVDRQVAHAIAHRAAHRAIEGP